MVWKMLARQTRQLWCPACVFNNEGGCGILNVSASKCVLLVSISSLGHMVDLPRRLTGGNGTPQLSTYILLYYHLIIVTICYPFFSTCGREKYPDTATGRVDHNSLCPHKTCCFALNINDINLSLYNWVYTVSWGILANSIFCMPSPCFPDSLNPIIHSPHEHFNLLWRDSIPHFLCCFPKLVKGIGRPWDVRNSIFEQVP